jgi:ABC-type Zn uptake system ZnuABC Zn-binding protein ZnuA
MVTVLGSRAVLGFLSVFALDALLASGAVAAETVPRVVVSTPAIAPLVRSLSAQRRGAQVRVLPGSVGVCAHEHQATPADVRLLAQSSIVLGVGLGFDAFLAKAAAAAPAPRVVLVAERVPEAYRLACHDQVHAAIPAETSAETTATDHRHPHGGWNPHLWTSPLHAAHLATAIAAALAEADPAGADDYAAALPELRRRLEHAAVAVPARLKGVPVLVEHGTLSYFAAAAGLAVAGVVQEDHHAALSPADMQRLLDVARAHGVKLVLLDPQFGLRSAARTLAAELGVPVVELDAGLQSPAEAGVEYLLAVWAANLQRVDGALSR